MPTNRLTWSGGRRAPGRHFRNSPPLLVKARGRTEKISKRSAFTHAAIENLLVKVQDSVDEFGLTAALPIYKLRSLRTPGGKRSLEVLPHDRADTVIGYPSLLLGGTVHSFGRLDKVLPSLDVLVIDEASQMRPAELAMVIPVLADGGRLILAGDDLQLPPVIQGDYPVPDDGLPGLRLHLPTSGTVTITPSTPASSGELADEPLSHGSRQRRWMAPVTPATT